MTKISVMPPVPCELLALMVAENVPHCIGVPEIKPVAPLRARPVGNPAAVKLVGWHVAVIW